MQRLNAVASLPSMRDIVTSNAKQQRPKQEQATTSNTDHPSNISNDRKEPIFSFEFLHLVHTTLNDAALVQTQKDADPEPPLPKNFFAPLPESSFVPKYVQTSADKSDDRIPVLAPLKPKASTKPKVTASYKRPAASAKSVEQSAEQKPENNDQSQKQLAKKSKQANGQVAVANAMSDVIRGLIERLYPEWLLQGKQRRDDCDTVRVRNKTENGKLMYQMLHGSKNVMHFPSQHFDEDMVINFAQFYQSGATKEEVGCLKKRFIKAHKEELKS